METSGERRSGPLARLRRFAALTAKGLDAVAQYAGLPVKWTDLQQAASGWVSLLRLGPWGVVGFLLFAGTLAGFGLVVSAPAGERSHLLSAPPALVLLGSVASLAFALGLSEVRRQHPLVRFAAGLYVLWYLLLAPVMALPRVVALLPAWALYVVEARRIAEDRARPVWLLPWALLLGRLSPLVLRPLWISVLAWTGVYAAIGFVLVRRPPSGFQRERAALFWSMAAVYAWGVLQGPTRLAQALHLGYGALFTFLGLFWMWLAADLVDDASEAAERAVGRLSGLLTRRWVPYGVGGALTVAGSTFLLAALVPRAVLEALPLGVLWLVGGFLRSAWTDGLALCGALMVLAGILTWLRATRAPDPVDAAADGLASGVVLVLVYWAAAQAWAALSEVEEPSGWWPLVLASAPVLLEEFKQTAKGVGRGTAAGALKVLAVALLGITATSFRFAAEPGEAVRTTTLYPFLGMVLWGLPHLLTKLVAGWSVQIPSARLFFAGYFSGLPAALLLPDLRTGAPSLAVLLWPLALRLSGWHLAGPAGLRLGGGILLASGTLAFFYEPLPLPVPFAPWTDMVIRRLGEVRATDVLSWAQLVAWAGAALAGATFGVRSRVGWVGAALLWALWNRLFLR